MEDGEGRSAGAWPQQACRLVLRLLRDVAFYGSDAQQRMDIYVPDRVQGGVCAVFGAWRRLAARRQTHDRLVQNKLAHWAAQGVVLVSVNYRMLPRGPARRTGPRRRLGAVPCAATGTPLGWGCAALCAHGAFRRCTSGVVAGGVARAPARDQGRSRCWAPWHDSGAMDVEQTMEERHAPLFDKAFGRDPAYWRSVSPQQWRKARRSPDAGGVFQPAPAAPARRPGVCGAGRGAGCARDRAVAAALAWGCQ